MENKHQSNSNEVLMSQLPSDPKILKELNISDSELVIMRVVWSLGSTTADEIGRELSETYQWSPSTIKTFLARLIKKGLLKNSRDGRKYVYIATCSEDEAICQMTLSFLNKICAHKHANVILEMIDASSITAENKEAISEKLSSKNVVDEVTCDCINRLNCCDNN
ncbi:CopY/TcrY family copper transport repressor [Listeria monocytogenes]|jgi:BlaI family penicillinase repressor|uniref:CopY/TcrY family copper transport repressor n=2 Tax=Listeria monocytogenes TaxID=1639 RepID=Q2V4V4_LISMN|nr:MULTISPECIES: CopY/TcrY family copper transport repressor [Bacilli]MDA56799.1 CopY/TcrY family copper transport repressor [Listeria monocytogenes serotype 4b]ABB99938.1 hypothetical protein pCT0017 [Listeria monocytogenes]AGT06978.1 hypothetical protein M640_p00015 [Listeria monocytogenes]AGT07054.1 hypothetical protein M644_p00050 [Listeria monocytogenes]AGT07120.1 hypothetical protein M645_p00020 [Listeria monocytogenes]